MGVARNPLLPRPLSQPTGPAISMLPCPSCRACSPLVPRVLQNPLSLTTLQAPLQPQRQEEEKWNTPSSGVPCMFHISSVSTSPTPTKAGEEPRLGLGKCAWLSHCPNAHQPCVPMLTCLIGAAVRAIPAVNVAKCSVRYGPTLSKRSMTKAACELQGLVAKVQDTKIHI